MLTESIARRYAKALFDAALAQKQLDTVNHELAEIGKTLGDDRRLKEIWNSSRLFAPTKKDFTKKVFPSLSPLVMNYLFLLIDKQREKVLESSREEYEKLVLDFYNQAFVEVRSVGPVPESVQADLKARLSARTGKRVELVIVQDPSLIGGMVVKIGDVILDGSLRTKLQALREDLLNSPLYARG